MNKSIIIALAIFFVVLSACDNGEPQIYSFSGKAQKGPFITGTTITVNELNDQLGQTGRAFNTTIGTDDGSFALNNIELNSPYVLLTATGYYFSEIYGELSSGTLTLQAFSDLTDKETVNINILTHVIKGRVETLVNEGLSVIDANEQATNEFLDFLGVDNVQDVDFNKMDISKGDDHNAILLAFSIMVQRYTLWWNERSALTAELTQLLTIIYNDFAPDGDIDDQKIAEQLSTNISYIDFSEIRSNINSRYNKLGINVSLPDFEKYIAAFQKKHIPQQYESFYYPAEAPPFPFSTPESILQNLLFKETSHFKSGSAYCMSAVIPYDANLKIRYASSNNISYLPPIEGWKYSPISSSEIKLEALHQNSIVSILIYLEGTGTGTIEYFENSSDTPTYAKEIYWD
ncbi:MAG: hypothetical protein JW798_16675 [Prolixibacteraceae bacterium]|nr:hypothetical protein [Prolixibacteraceae bacterium]